MKKLMTLALMSLISTQTFAGTYGCKKEYDAKFEAMNNRSDLIPVAGLMAGFIVPVTVSTMGAAVIVTAPLAVGALVANGASWFIQMHNDDKIYAAHTVLDETQYSREEVLARAREVFNQQAVYEAKQKMAKVNRGREYVGLPDLTFAEYLAQNPLATFNPETHMTALDVFAKTLNEHYGSNFSREEIENKVRELAKDKTFCETKVATFNKVLKITHDHL